MDIRWRLLSACSAISLLIMVVFIRIALVVVTVQSFSMSPTLKHGDRVLVFRYWPARWLRKGHIVIVQPPSPEMRYLTKPVPFVKRVVGLPGDTVVTYLNQLNEYYRARLSDAHDEAGSRTWHVPPGHLFVRGDYVLGGTDSLSWGPIPFKSIQGIVLMKLSRDPLDTSNQL
jgi:signal peptidase I